MSAARYHRRTDDDTAISSMNSTNRSKYYCTTLLFVVDNPLSKYNPQNGRSSLLSCGASAGGTGASPSALAALRAFVAGVSAASAF